MTRHLIFFLQPRSWWRRRRGGVGGYSRESQDRYTQHAGEAWRKDLSIVALFWRLIPYVHIFGWHPPLSVFTPLSFPSGSIWRDRGVWGFGWGAPPFSYYYYCHCFCGGAASSQCQSCYFCHGLPDSGFWWVFHCQVST